uniref:Uncharacterized protein n=1 Tax=viral metagenome TaxID=1070528 RepID=A0A6C0HGK7_9ZZZZ
MNTIFTLGNETDENNSINLDDLYERKKQYDLNTLSIYNKLLNRIHNRIKTVSRQQLNEQYCWYVVPEIILGIPKFDHGACTAYLIDKLQSNGFIVRYTHPNLLLICWKDFIPSYVRDEIKKKTGIVIDGKGNKVEKGDTDAQQKMSDDPNELMFQRGNKLAIENKSNKEFKSIDSYKPTGNLIYNENLLKSTFKTTF